MRFPTLAPLLAVLAMTPAAAFAQKRGNTPKALVRTRMVGHGYMADDLADLFVKDYYRDQHNGVEHTFLRQRWKGIEVYNGNIAVHQAPDGHVIALNNGAWPYCGKTAESPEPLISAGQALATVLRKDLPGAGMPALLSTSDQGRLLVYDGSNFGNEPVKVQLMYLPSGKKLRLVWNVSHYQPDGAHWWNVRISAKTGNELDRNDWVSQCGFKEALERRKMTVNAPEEAPATPLVVNKYKVYPVPVESPDRGGRSIVQAPWNAGGVASPYGWHDTNGAPGAEYTVTRGNNVLAQQDGNFDNGDGHRPDGGASLFFDFPIDFTRYPILSQDASLTNLFYWNNMMHDIWYQYGFDEVSGNFQQNNYGRGGAHNDYVFADGLDGGGVNNADFATPPDGTNPRMQIYLWSYYATPARDGDYDGGLLSHEYGHGISNRLVGGPSSSGCLSNQEQMGEGWSDFFALMMTMVPSDTRTGPRGMFTYLVNQPFNGTGVRPAPYCTSFGVNGFTYADTDSSGYQEAHSVGFIWCTMLWEMTWDLIDRYGFDPDLYHGTGGNNMAMQLVIDGLKLTPCSPGFTDARDAILQADSIDYGGANQALIWAAFARRGLGYSADQGSSDNIDDQVEAYDVPPINDLGTAAVLSPEAGEILVCEDRTDTVRALLRNFGNQPLSGFSVQYSLDGAPPVSQTYNDTLAGGATEPFTFSQPITLSTAGNHTIAVSTVLAGDEHAGDDLATNALNGVEVTTVDAPYAQDVEGGNVTPAGWILQNPDDSITWTTADLNIGADCAATTAWMISYILYNNVGEEDRLLSPKIDLAGLTGSHLTFDHAYARYNANYYDGFRVDVSNDCGTSWNVLYEASGSALATAPDNGTNWQPEDCSEWAAHDIDLSAYDGERIIIRFTGICGYGQRLYFDNVNVSGTPANVALDARMYLEGCYNPNEHRMDDQLRANGQLPATEPYTALGFNLPGGGGETAASGLFAVTGDDAIVDWAVVELRSANDSTQVVAAQCALLQRDGDVVAADGTADLHFAVPAGNYYVAVRHRNHLGCMTPSAISLSATPGMVDFGLPATATYGTDARRAADGRMLLWAGNALRDGNLRYTGAGNDRDPILQAVGGNTPTATSTGYAPTDVNLDGVVKYTGTDNDRDALLENIGGITPTEVREEQLP